MNISKLPVGVYSNNKPVCVSLDSRNMLLNGNPRSGKSVFLSSLICSLLRCRNERVIVFSPKTLDFQNFSPVVQLVKEPDEMLRVLNDLKDIVEVRKDYCIKKGIKKITDYTKKNPHFTIIVDEFTVIKTTTKTDEKGKVVKVGEQIETELMRLVSETGFSGVSFVFSTQRVSSTNMNTNLRDIISGNRISFATSSTETNKMIFGDWSDVARCDLITRDQVGCGYISVDDYEPRPFKGSMITKQDELTSVEIWRQLNED